MLEELQHIDIGGIDKKKILIISAIIAFVLIIAIIYIVFLENKEESQLPRKEQERQIPLTIADCANEIDKEKKENCIYNVAKIKANVEWCEHLSDEAYKDECIIEIAAETFDLKICAKYFKEKPFRTEQCEEATKVLQVLNDKNIPLEECKNFNVSESKGLCFKGKMSQLRWDCEKIENDFYKKLCISKKNFLTTKSIKECEEIPLEQYRKVCKKICSTGKKIYELDSDNDGIDDGVELFLFLNPFNPDTDNDGLSDGEEISVYRTNPVEKDTDNDGLSDYEEIKIRHTNPQKPNDE